MDGRGGNRARSAQLAPFPDGCSNRHFRKQAVLVPADSSLTLDLAGAVDVVVVVVVVAVVVVALHTFRRRIRSNCCSVGEGSFHKQDIEEHHVVDLPWAPNKRN